MSQDIDQIADTLPAQPTRSGQDIESSTCYDDLIIEDRPTLYSVCETASTHHYSVTDPKSMIEKLKAEITHLENWLSQQLESRSGSLSITNTIRRLIATRKSLLENLLQKEKGRSQPDRL